MLSRAGGTYRVHAGDEVIEASLRGRFKRKGRKRVLVGDRVVIAGGEGGHTVEEILPRRSVLKRRSPGKSHGTRAVAANVDQVAVVGSVGEPQWNPNLMDRFLAVAEANGLPSLVVVNKCDLGADGERYAEPYRLAGYPVLLTSVPERVGIEELGRHLEGRTSLLTGATGVGKSSLLNALQPGLRLRERPVSRKAGVGRHTTVAAEMHPFGQSGYVVDTPGLRDVGLWGLEPMEVAGAFPEIARLQGLCKFDNCRHLTEPGCAVQAAVEEGELAASRLQSYRQLLEESERALRPWES